MKRENEKPRAEQKQQNANEMQGLLELQPEAPTPIQQATQGASRVGGSKIDSLDTNSLNARWALEKWSVVRELWRAQYQMATYYMKPEGGSHSLEEAIRMASIELGEGTMLEEEMERICSGNVDSISWYGLDRVFRAKPSYAQKIWEEVKEQALNDFIGGHFAAEMFEHTDWQNNVWKRAHFVVVYEEMTEAYKPRDAIEQTMVEMVAVNFFLWRHWVTEHLQRATTEPRCESQDYKEWRKDRKYSHMLNGNIERREYSGQYLDGAWDMPYQKVAEAIGHALEMADRCRRAYHASVRSLRDWRRYSVPVTINNPQQVNIAADGGQQVNVQEDRKKTKGSKSKTPVRLERSVQNET